MGGAKDELELCKVKAVQLSAYLNATKDPNRMYLRPDTKLLFLGNWFHNFQL